MNKRIILVASILYFSCFSMGTGIEHEVHDPRIRRHYYFSLLPEDMKNMLRGFYEFPTGAQVDDAFNYGNLDSIEFCASIAKKYDVEDRFYSAGFRHGDSKIAHFFLDLGGDPNGYHSKWGRPLGIAVGADHADIVKLLLAAGAQPDYETEGLLLPLQKAAGNGYAPIVRLLLAAGANPNGKRYDSDDTALNLAAQKGFLEVVQMLLDAGADCNVDPQGQSYSPLYYAARSNHIQVAQLLIKHNADVNHFVGLPGDSSALSAAALAGHFDMVKLLLDAGANPDCLESRPIERFLENLRFDCLEFAPNIEKMLHLLVQKSKRKEEYVQYIGRALQRKGIDCKIFKVKE